MKMKKLRKKIYQEEYNTPRKQHMRDQLKMMELQLSGHRSSHKPITSKSIIKIKKAYDKFKLSL